MNGLLGPTDREYVASILDKNRDKDFVQRILHPQLYPQLPLGDGWMGTHMMAHGDNLAFPTIFHQMGLLSQEKDFDKARDRAMRRREYIQFPNTEAADWFARNYKAYWNDDR
jgi:hypothetical protein